MSNRPDQPGPAMLASLAQIAHHRWMIPVLAACDRTEGGGLKYVTFLHRLGISRDSLGRTLAAGIAEGWLRHNPGVGHPMRPEYILTHRGWAIASHARHVLESLRSIDAEELGLCKWSLPVLAAIAVAADPPNASSKRSSAARFSEITRILPDATGRAISLTLRDLQDGGLIDREVVDTYPPTARYTLTRRAKRVAAAARALARAAGVRIVGAAPSDLSGGASVRRAKSA